MGEEVGAPRPQRAVLPDSLWYCLVLATTYPQAGLVSREDAEKLLIALEPEAASVYCRKLRLHQLMDLSSRTTGGGRLGERRSIDSSFRHGKMPQGCCLVLVFMASALGRSESHRNWRVSYV